MNFKKIAIVIVLDFLIESANAVEATAFLYSRDNPRVPVQGFEDGLFDKTKPLKIIIHGWLGSMLYTVYSDMTDSFLHKEDCIVVVYDWSKSNGEYSRSVRNARLNGVMLADLLYNIFDHFGNIHLIGYGIGAHLAGFTGKTISEYTNGTQKIGRITGLDPTLPRFNGTSERLEKTDAEFVDVYHCDSYRYGIGEPIGSIDFYPNGGVAPLPGCDDKVQSIVKLLYGAMEEVFCSHAECRTYFKSSILNNGMIAVKCESWSMFLEGRCNGNEAVTFGEDVKKSASGSFYIKI